MQFNEGMAHKKRTREREEIKGKGIRRSYDVAPGQSYPDWEGEYEYVR